MNNVASLFGGMLPGGRVSKEKFKSLSVKDSKDIKTQPNAALPMMPVIARLWCHEVSRTFADRLLLDEGQCATASEWSFSINRTSVTRITMALMPQIEIKWDLITKI